MSFDSAKFKSFDRSRFDYNKSYTNKNSGNDYPFIEPKELPDGRHSFRFVPGFPGRCSAGFRRIIMHRVPRVLGETKPANVFCLRAEGEDDAMCDVLEALAEYKSTLSQQTQAALDEMRMREQLLFPILIDVMKDPNWVKPADKTDFDRPVIKTPDGKRRGAILSMRDLGKLPDKIGSLFEQDPSLNSQYAGRELYLVKTGHKYDVEVRLDLGDRTAVREDEMVWLTEAKYPRIDSMFSKTYLKWTYAEAFDQLQKSFWWGGVAHLGIGPAEDVTDIRPYSPAPLTGITSAQVPY